LVIPFIIYKKQQIITFLYILGANNTLFTKPIKATLLKLAIENQLIRETISNTLIQLLKHNDSNGALVLKDLKSVESLLHVWNEEERRDSFKQIELITNESKLSLKCNNNSFNMDYPSTKMMNYEISKALLSCEVDYENAKLSIPLNIRLSNFEVKPHTITKKRTRRSKTRNCVIGSKGGRSRAQSSLPSKGIEKLQKREDIPYSKTQIKALLAYKIAIDEHSIQCYKNTISHLIELECYHESGDIEILYDTTSNLTIHSQSGKEVISIDKNIIEHCYSQKSVYPILGSVKFGEFNTKDSISYFEIVILATGIEGLVKYHLIIIKN